MLNPDTDPLPGLTGLVKSGHVVAADLSGDLLH
jgi:hypothetical protein